MYILHTSLANLPVFVCCTGLTGFSENQTENVLYKIQYSPDNLTLANSHCPDNSYCCPVRNSPPLTKTRCKIGSDNLHAQIIRTIFPRIAVRIMQAPLQCSMSEHNCVSIDNEKVRKLQWNLCFTTTCCFVPEFLVLM